MRRATYWLFPLIASGVAVFIVILLYKINPAAPKVEAVEYDEIQSSETPTGQKNWMSRFSVSEEKGYFYPVNEVSLKLDMGGESSASAVYRLSVGLKSSYELFCVKQELKKSALPYFMHKEGKVMTLTVDSTDQSKLASLVTKLKTYQITATVSPYTEEK
ncbi:hypothetical protein [Sulfuricurvum sp.]|uniref:hypothetical protein n=1 Tax=Sulfuricurvum sp. TaxID=2025608 RepID=UPI003BB06D2D